MDGARRCRAHLVGVDGRGAVSPRLCPAFKARRFIVRSSHRATSARERQCTATHTGDRFFQTPVESLARALGTHGAWITEYLPESRRLRALAFWLRGEWIQGFEHP